MSENAAETNVKDIAGFLQGFTLQKLTEVVESPKEEPKVDPPKGEETPPPAEPPTDTTEPKEEPKPDDNEPAPVFGTIAREFVKYTGLDVSDEQLVEIMKEDSVEGLTNFIQAVVDASTPKLPEELEEAYQALQEGKSLREFFVEKYGNESKSYVNLDANALTKDEKRKLIFDYQKQNTKLADSRIEKIVASLEADEAEFDEAAKEALQDLKERELKVLKEKEEKEKLTKAQQEEYAKQQAERVKEQVTKFIDGANTIAGFEINQTQKQKFKDFLLNPTELVTEINPATGKETGRKVKITPYEKLMRENKNISMELAYVAFLGLSKEKIAKFVESDVTSKILKGLKSPNSSGATATSTAGPTLQNPDKIKKQDLVKGFTLDNLTR